MVDRPYPTQFFTRLQMKDLTGIDDTALNYWSRENVLRSAEGGGGKGQHRRFQYMEINLAALLDQLRGFGVGLSAMKGLAERFHAAMDYMASLRIDRLNVGRAEALSMLMTARNILAERGYYPWRIYPLDDRDMGSFAELPKHDIWTHNLSYEVRLDWPQTVALLRSGGLGPNYTDEVVALAESLDLEEYRTQDNYWSFISYINFQKPDEEVSTDPSFFYRDEGGEWHLTPDNREAAREAISFIAVDMDRLSYRVWAKK